MNSDDGITNFALRNYILEESQVILIVGNMDIQSVLMVYEDSII